MQPVNNSSFMNAIVANPDVFFNIVSFVTPKEWDCLSLTSSKLNGLVKDIWEQERWKRYDTSENRLYLSGLKSFTREEAKERLDQIKINYLNLLAPKTIGGYQNWSLAVQELVVVSFSTDTDREVKRLNELMLKNNAQSFTLQELKFCLQQDPIQQALMREYSIFLKSMEKEIAEKLAQQQPAGEVGDNVISEKPYSLLPAEEARQLAKLALEQKQEDNLENRLNLSQIIVSVSTLSMEELKESIRKGAMASINAQCQQEYKKEFKDMSPSDQDQLLEYVKKGLDFSAKLTCEIMVKKHAKIFKVQKLRLYLELLVNPIAQSVLTKQKSVNEITEEELLKELTVGL